MSSRTRLVAVLLVAAAGIGLLASGWVEVRPGEVVVVRRFGKALPALWTQGPHLAWPVGIDQLDRVRVDEVRRLEVGLAGTPGPNDAPGAGEMLTGDLNLLRVRAVLQYRVADPKAYVLRARDVRGLLERITEAGLARAIARRSVDEALRAGRPILARDAQDEVAHQVLTERLGLAILSLSLTDARPPAEVQPDFDAAQKAQSDHDRRLLEARAYGATILPVAQAGARVVQERARAQSERHVAEARGRAARFLSLLAEADRSRRLTVRQLYLDAVNEMLPRVRRKLLLTPEEPLDLSILGAEAK